MSGAEHPASVVRDGGRYPFRATCPCGWTSRGYLAAHAAQIMADDHHTQEEDTVTLERYTIPDIAAALDVRPNTVSSYNARRQMPTPTGHVGRTPYWDAADIEPWITERRAARVASHVITEEDR